MEKETGKKIDDETKEAVRQEFLNPTSNYKLLIPKEDTFKPFLSSEKLTKIFFCMKWSLCFAEHGYYITSDNPIVRIVTGGDHPIYGDHGFMNKTAEVSFPLTPKLMLIMSWQEDAKEIGVLERQHVQYLNRLRAAEAEQSIYAHLRDKRLERLVALFAKDRPQLKHRGFGPKTFTPVEVRR